MDSKENILEESRSENKGRDLFREAVDDRAGNYAYITGLLLWVFFSVVRDFVGLDTHLGEFAIGSSMMAAFFIVKVISTRRRRYLPLVVFSMITALYASITHLAKLISGSG